MQSIILFYCTISQTTVHYQFLRIGRAYFAKNAECITIMNETAAICFLLQRPQRSCAIINFNVFRSFRIYQDKGLSGSGREYWSGRAYLYSTGSYLCSWRSAAFPPLASVRKEFLSHLKSRILLSFCNNGLLF